MAKMQFMAQVLRDKEHKISICYIAHLFDIKQLKLGLNMRYIKTIMYVCIMVIYYMQVYPHVLSGVIKCNNVFIKITFFCFISENYKQSNTQKYIE